MILTENNNVATCSLEFGEKMQLKLFITYPLNTWLFASMSGKADGDGCYLQPCEGQSDGKRWLLLWSSTNS